MEFEAVTVQAGACVVHAQDTWHGSGPNESERRHRRALVVHFIQGSSRFLDGHSLQVWERVFDCCFQRRERLLVMAIVAPPLFLEVLHKVECVREATTIVGATVDCRGTALPETVFVYLPAYLDGPYYDDPR